MREYLFRGKLSHCRYEKKPGDWAHGSLFVGKVNKPKIKWYDEHYGTHATGDVDPETVGQYIGLNDVNGIRIFENDICLAQNWLKEKLGTYQIIFEDGCFLALDDCGTSWHMNHLDCVTVIGNIYDNPEFLFNREGVQ